jgi:hypothetical protein
MADSNSGGASGADSSRQRRACGSQFIHAGYWHAGSGRPSQVDAIAPAAFALSLRGAAK